MSFIKAYLPVSYLSNRLWESNFLQTNFYIVSASKPTVTQLQIIRPYRTQLTFSLQVTKLIKLVFLSKH